MGYRAGDLKDLVSEIFEVDSYQSKMGDDGDIVVVSFSVKETQAAKDLVDFIEKGYDFVLDADATSGELREGDYKVFVELERNRESNDHIMEIMDGVGKLTDISDWRFRYYKSFDGHDLSLDSLTEHVPTDPDNYGVKVEETRMNNYKNFFNKSYVDEVVMEGNVLTVKKPYADAIQFQYIDFGKTVPVLNRITESFNTNDFAEVIFLSKYLGDYNITKYGNKFTLDNSGHTLVLERI